MVFSKVCFFCGRFLKRSPILSAIVVLGVIPGIFFFLTSRQAQLGPAERSAPNAGPQDAAKETRDWIVAHPESAGANADLQKAHLKLIGELERGGIFQKTSSTAGTAAARSARRSRRAFRLLTI